jgi:hypothetical protein
MYFDNIDKIQLNYFLNDDNDLQDLELIKYLSDNNNRVIFLLVTSMISIFFLYLIY